MESFLWIGPTGDRGGYGGVARNYLRGLSQAGAQVAIRPLGGTHEDIGERDLALVSALPTTATGDETVVVHADPLSLGSLVPRVRGEFAGPVCACTISETDRISPASAAACNLADEVWVPTTFNLLTFAASGVEQSKLRLVPYGIDLGAWDVEGPVSGLVPEGSFCFLYTFAFDWRKGFDLLLGAYLNEFTREDPVTLVIKVYDPGSRVPGAPTVRQKLALSAVPYADLLRPDLPEVMVLDQPFDKEELRALYRRSDLYISTDRANGWGMPCMETMALARPAATIDWSGSTEFMTEENALLIPPGPLEPVDPRLSTERPDYAGQRWAHVALADVQRVLRSAYAGERDLADLGRRGRSDLERHWTAADSAGWILERNRSPYRSRPGLAERLRPQIGLAENSPFADARGRILATAFDGHGAWRDAVLAYLESCSEQEDVSLYVWATLPASAESVAQALGELLDEHRLDPEHVPDLVATADDPAEALVEPRVLAFVGSEGLWPTGRPHLPPSAAALRELLDATVSDQAK